MAKKKAPKKPKLEEGVEEIIEQEVTYTCPVRGKVTEKVKIKKLKPKATSSQITVIESNDDLLAKLDKDDDLVEELGVDDE
jgi:hypothetical protein